MNMSAMLDRERCQDDMPFVHIHTEVGLVLKGGDSALLNKATGLSLIRQYAQASAKTLNLNLAQHKHFEPNWQPKINN